MPDFRSRIIFANILTPPFKSCANPAPPSWYILLIRLNFGNSQVGQSLTPRKTIFGVTIITKFFYQIQTSRQILDILTIFLRDGRDMLARNFYVKIIAFGIRPRSYLRFPSYSAKNHLICTILTGFSFKPKIQSPCRRVFANQKIKLFYSDIFYSYFINNINLWAFFYLLFSEFDLK